MKGYHHTGWSKSKTQKCWAHMLDRCNNPKAGNYNDYGGRGITVCVQWNYFENFLNDMGPMPEKLSLERINNNKGYNPENCKWATATEQSRNRRATRRSKTGYSGVRKHGKKYGAYIYIDNHQLNLGQHDTLEQAVAARKEAEKKYWGLDDSLDKRIPKQITVGGLTFNIDYPHAFLERTDISGRIMFDTHEIFITNRSQTGEVCANAHSFRTYLHEVFHALDKIYCADLMGAECEKEILVDSLAVGMAQFLTDNYYMIVKK